MLLSAVVLGEHAPEENQRRVLWRYAFLYGDALRDWARRWRNQLKRDPVTSRRARTAKPAVEHLAAAVDQFEGIRDYLAAKRQPVHAMRADDMEATAQLWLSVNHPNVIALAEAAIACFDALDDGGIPILNTFLHSPPSARQIEAVLGGRDPRRWHVAADTAAELRVHTLPAGQGGPIGRRVAQINDAAMHLEVLLPLVEVTWGQLPYEWLVSSALVTELSTLLALSVGITSPYRPGMLPLSSLCGLGRAATAEDDLRALRDSLGTDGVELIQWLRNKVGAHVDADLTMFQIQHHLIELDLAGLVRVAEHLLDGLDRVACGHLDLTLLAFGERPIQGWPTNKTLPGMPMQPRLAGSLGPLFRQFDSPYVIGTGSSMGSAVVAGMTAGRQPTPRARVWKPPRRNILELPARKLEVTHRDGRYELFN